jgi:hypothetical protein
MENASAPAYKGIMGIIVPCHVVRRVLDLVTERQHIASVTVKLDITGIFAKKIVALDALERFVLEVVVFVEVDVKPDIGEPTAITHVHPAMLMDVIKTMEHAYLSACRDIMVLGALRTVVPTVRIIDVTDQQVFAPSAMTDTMERDVPLFAALDVLVMHVHSIRACARLAVNLDITELVAQEIA